MRETSADEKHWLCGGSEAGEWEEVADLAFVEQDLAAAEFEERHVMSTSHDGDPPAEIAFFSSPTTRTSTGTNSRVTSRS